MMEDQKNIAANWTTSLLDLPLRTRSRNLLLTAGMRTVADAVLFIENGGCLRNLRNCGATSEEDILQAIHKAVGWAPGSWKYFRRGDIVFLIGENNVGGIEMLQIIRAVISDIGLDFYIARDGRGDWWRFTDEDVLKCAFFSKSDAVNAMRKITERIGGCAKQE